MEEYESDHWHTKRCDREFIKIPREALEELDCITERLDRDLGHVYRVAERNPIAAYREFIRVMNRFSNNSKRINARVFDTLDLNEAIRERHLPVGLLFKTRPMPDPPVTGATTVFANVAVPPAPPPTVSRLTPEQLATIRDIIQRAAEEIRSLRIFRRRLRAILSESNNREGAIILFIFTSLAIDAAIEEILRNAAVDIINVLLAT